MYSAEIWAVVTGMEIQIFPPILHVHQTNRKLTGLRIHIVITSPKASSMVLGGTSISMTLDLMLCQNKQTNKNSGLSEWT